MNIKTEWTWKDVVLFAILLGGGVFLIYTGKLSVSQLVYALGYLFLKAPVTLDNPPGSGSTHGP